MYWGLGTANRKSKEQKINSLCLLITLFILAATCTHQKCVHIYSPSRNATPASSNDVNKHISRWIQNSFTMP